MLNYSEASPSIGLCLGVDSCISLELDKNLFGLPEILPGSLGADVDTTVGISGPAVLARIEEVIGVSIGHLLIPVETLAVKPVLRLQCRWEHARTEVVEDGETQEEGNCETLNSYHKHWQLRR